MAWWVLEKGATVSSAKSILEFRNEDKYASITKDVFEKTVFEQKDENTGNTIGTLKCEKPIHVLFEGVNTDIFHKTTEKDDEVEKIMSEVDGDCFLFIGHWLKGEMGQDRKDVSGLIKVFCETFKGLKKPPSLVIKTSGADFSHIDRRDIRNSRIRDSITYCLTCFNYIKSSISSPIKNIIS